MSAIESTHDIWPTSTGYSWEVCVYDRASGRTTLLYTSGWSHTKITAKIAVWVAIQDWKRAIRRAGKEATR